MKKVTSSRPRKVTATVASSRPTSAGQRATFTAIGIAAVPAGTQGPKAQFLVMPA
jgi:hypothetical protein